MNVSSVEHSEPIVPGHESVRGTGEREHGHETVVPGREQDLLVGGRVLLAVERPSTATGFLWR